MTEENFAWFAGIDWGSERHQPCLVDPQGRIRLGRTQDKPAVTVR
jgi:hypothetical protein